MKSLLIAFFLSLLSIVVAECAWVADVLRRSDAVGSGILALSFVVAKYYWVANVLRLEAVDCGILACLDNLLLLCSPLLLLSMRWLLIFQGGWRLWAVEFL